MPNLALYSASKSYFISLTRALAEEMRDSDLKISVLVPGPVDTAFVQHGGVGVQRFAPMLTPQAVACAIAHMTGGLELPKIFAPELAIKAPPWQPNVSPMPYLIFASRAGVG